MKTKLTLLLLFAVSLANAQIVFLDLGTSANDGTGDKLRPGGIKINTNFFWLSNLTWTASNSLRSTLIANDTTTSNGAVAFSMTASNTLYSFTETASSNRVRLVGGTGGITVSQAGSGGVQTWTINDDDAGGGGSDAGGTNARQFGTLVLTNLSSTASNNVDYVTALTTLTNVANTASNRTWTADSWSTNRHAAAFTNNHSVSAPFNTNVTVGGSLTVTNGAAVVGLTNTGPTLLTSTVRVGDSAFAGTDAVIKKNGANSDLMASALSVSSSSNLTGIHNITSAGTNTATAFVASGSPGSLQTDNGYFNTNLHARNLTLTNGMASIPSTVSGVGGANTNFTLQHNSGVVYLDAATTNINILAIMGGEATRQWRGVVIATNRGATSRTFSLGAITNNFIALQTYDGAAAPYTVTNAQALWFSWEMLGTNVYYAAKHMANPPN